MFETLTERLNNAFKRLRGKGKLTEKDLDEALREVRMALLEADVNFKVVKSFVGRVRERGLGAEVLESLTPGQQVIKIVHDELLETLGTAERLDLSGPSPHVIMLVGLQGAGKTTMAGKLALHLRKSGQRPLMVAADVHRPAAIQQLITLGKQIDIPVYSEPAGAKPPDITANAIRKAREGANTVVILDTAGRLHVDDEMMAEVQQVKARTNPVETLLVADAMTGQDAVKVAEAFNQQLSLTGLILTKVDGDARGGAALSIRAVTGVPIKYLGVGEKLDAIEPFHPDRLAQRILGMGDVLTLIEKAQENFDQTQAEQLQKKMRNATFDLEDMVQQLQAVKRMGPLSQILDMIPGMSAIKGKLPKEAVDDNSFKRIEAIIYSMTPEERRNPDIINGSRRRRIARGSGTTPQEINQLLNQFHEMRKMMKQMARGKGPRGFPGLPV